MLMWEPELSVTGPSALVVMYQGHCAMDKHVGLERRGGSHGRAQTMGTPLQPPGIRGVHSATP